MSCRKALLALDRRGVIRLPKSKGNYTFQERSNPALPEGTKVADVECSLAELGEIEIIGVSSRYGKPLVFWLISGTTWGYAAEAGQHWFYSIPLSF